jgi:hygromycin-B 7''-O-kinase
VRRTGGELSGVYEARLEDSDAAVIVKVYAPEWVWKQAKEIHVYGLLSAAHAKSWPTVIAAEDDTNPTGHAYTVMTKVAGTPLSEVGLRARNDRTVPLDQPLPQ